MAERRDKEAVSALRAGPTRPEQIFFDRGHRRGRIFAVSVIAILSLVLSWVVTFSAHLYLVEKTPLPATVEDIPVSTDGAARFDFGAVPQNVCDTSPFPPILPPSHDPALRSLPTETVFAYLPYLPEATYASLEAGADAIDVLMPEWYKVIDANSGFEKLNRQAEHQVYLQDLIDRAVPEMEVIPVVTVEHLALPTDEASRGVLVNLAEELAGHAAAVGYPGLAILPDGIDLEEIPAFAFFARKLDTALNVRGLNSHLLASIDSPLLIETGVVDAMDLVILKAFQEPWVGTPPGPLAASDWFEARVRWAIENIGREKLVVMLGAGAVDWSRQAAAPERLSVADAFSRLATHRGKLDFPDGVGNLRMRYDGPTGAPHEIWVLDAASQHNQLAVLSDLEMRRVGLWSLGFEDPTAWPLFSARWLNPESAARFLSKVDLSDFVVYSGRGSFQRLIKPAAVGERVLGFDLDTGLINDQGFATLPEPWSIRRYGQAEPDAVAITFDDGPDPEFTDEILNILLDRNASATFFLVGARVLQSNEIVQRMVAEGHEIGSHTFLHPRLGDFPALRTRFEINAVQRLLAVVTGRGTVFFRTPYGRSEGPMTGDDAAPMTVLDQTLYLVVGSDVVPPDWLDLDAGEIVEYVMDDLENHGGNVIVLHDGGGNRQATVDAVGPLIDRLRADGYRIVSLSEMLGIDRDQAMPLVGGSRAFLDQLSFGLIGAVSDWFLWLFWFLIVAGVLRSIVVLGLALGRRPHEPDVGGGTPPVTVVIPAYNEERTIIACLDSVLASDYPDIRVIVIDDGSTDHTYENVKAYVANKPGISVVHEPNMGKWMALDSAYSLIDTEIVVAIDADSLLDPGAISKLARHFADPTVGAVAGRVRVGNRRGLLPNLQALEYLTAQSIERRAFERLNAILVVPGAIGAWRTRAVYDAGLYSSDTVTEDADLTVSVIRAGYRVVYDEMAFAVTEVPETVKLFLRQRLRWSFGMLQTAFKHLAGGMRQRLAVGWVALPDLLIVGFGFSILAPLVDLILIGTLIDIAVDVLLDRPEPVLDIRPWLLLGYAFLPLLDVVLILAALRFDRSESIGLVLLFPIQRFFYRQLMYFSALRAMYRAAIGKLAQWGRLKRTGHARLASRTDN